jgi:hypothetical protein
MSIPWFSHYTRAVFLEVIAALVIFGLLSVFVPVNARSLALTYVLLTLLNLYRSWSYQATAGWRAAYAFTLKAAACYTLALAFWIGS